MGPIGFVTTAFFAALLSIGVFYVTRNLWRPLARAALPFLGVWLCLVLPGIFAARAWNELSGSGLRGLVIPFGLAAIPVAVGCLTLIEGHLARRGLSPSLIYVAVLSSIALVSFSAAAPEATNDLTPFDMRLGASSALIVSACWFGWKMRARFTRSRHSNA